MDEYDIPDYNRYWQITKDEYFYYTYMRFWLPQHIVCRLKIDNKPPWKSWVVFINILSH